MQKGHAQRRMAAAILKCGKNRVWMDKEHMDQIATAITRDDIRKLIDKGIIRAKQRIGTGRFAARKRIVLKRKGRTRSAGSKRGGATSIVPRKRKWINTIRPIRAYLKALRNSKKLSTANYRKLYGLAAGGFFRSRSHLRTYMEKERFEVK